MTILPTAMRIQDDIPTMLGRRITRNDAEVVQIRKFYVEALEKESAVRAFEVQQHELSEKPEPAKPVADGWIPWGGGECPIRCDAGQWMYKLGDLDDLDILGSHPSDSLVYSYMWRYKGAFYRITAYKVL